MSIQHRQIILVDLDDTLANTEGHFLEIYKEKHPELPFIPFEKRNTFNLADQYPIESHATTRAIYRSKGFYRNVPPIAAAIKAMVELSELADVFLCSAHQGDYENCVLEKFEWIHEHLGKPWIKKTILTKDKTLIYAHKLIDDNPNIVGIRLPYWEHIIHTRPWNETVTDKKHLDWNTDWKAVLGL